MITFETRYSNHLQLQLIINTPESRTIHPNTISTVFPPLCRKELVRGGKTTLLTFYIYMHRFK